MEITIKELQYSPKNIGDKEALQNIINYATHLLCFDRDYYVKKEDVKHTIGENGAKVTVFGCATAKFSDYKPIKNNQERVTVTLAEEPIMLKVIIKFEDPIILVNMGSTAYSQLRIQPEMLQKAEKVFGNCNYHIFSDNSNNSDARVLASNIDIYEHYKGADEFEELLDVVDYLIKFGYNEDEIDEDSALSYSVSDVEKADDTHIIFKYYQERYKVFI